MPTFNYPHKGIRFDCISVLNGFCGSNGNNHLCTAPRTVLIGLVLVLSRFVFAVGAIEAHSVLVKLMLVRLGIYPCGMNQRNKFFFSEDAFLRNVCSPPLVCHCFGYTWKGLATQLCDLRISVPQPLSSVRLSELNPKTFILPVDNVLIFPAVNGFFKYL